MSVIAAVLKVVAAGLLAVFGLLSCIRPYFPYYRTIEIAPGVFDEQWISISDIWLDVGIGISCLTLSSLLHWSAYRKRDLK